MDNPRLYIVQFLGIFLLICGYLSVNKPDRESIMHFNLSQQHVYSGVSGDDEYDTEYIVAGSNADHNNHAVKFRLAKIFSLKTIIPINVIEFPYIPLLSVNYIVPLSENYHFLFCKEINPPPPRQC